MDIIQVLIIIGIIIFAVVKQLWGSKEEENKPQQKNRIPREEKEMADTEYDYTDPQPFLSYDYEPLTPSLETLRRSSPKRPDTRIEITAPPPIQEEPEEQQEFNIQSTEEVRRAIIWSEILNRKY